MKYYIEICDELVDAVPDLVQNRYALFDKQFDNLWAEQGLTIMMNVVNVLEDHVVDECVRFVDDQGVEVSIKRLDRIIDDNNVIW